MEVSLAGGPGRCSGVLDCSCNGLEGRGVLRVEDGERPGVPVDFHSEIVPDIRGEGRAEQDVQRVVEDLEGVRVRNGQ